ncbi:MAG: PKD domain-containing protein [Saprospiraceae bacterium]
MLISRLIFLLACTVIWGTAMAQCPNCADLNNDKADVWSIDCYYDDNCDILNICTANDVNVVGMFLGNSSGGPLQDCNPGETVTAYLWARLQANANSPRYALRMHADQFINGEYIECHNECLSDVLAVNEEADFLLHAFEWTCGDFISVENLIVGYTTDPAVCSDPNDNKYAGTCKDYNSSHCYYHADRLDVLTPNFSFTCGDTYNEVCFEDATAGGVLPYSYSWNFGDGATSNLEAMCHTYPAHDAYDVTLTITDANGLTAHRVRHVDLAEVGLNCCEFAITCPPSSDPGIYNCLTPIPDPATTLEEFESQFGPSVGANLCAGSEVSLTFADSPDVPDYCQPGSLARTYTFSDGSNEIDCVIEYTIDEPPAIEITVPENTVLQACSSQEDIHSAFTEWVNTFSFSGGCDLALTGDDPGLLPEPTACHATAYTINYEVTENCNGARISQEVSFTLLADSSPPTLSGVPDDLMATCEDVPPAADVNAEDDCDPFPEIRFEENMVEGQCANSYTIYRTWVGIDACGNQSPVYTQQIFVYDEDPPILIGVPDDVVASCTDIPEPPTVSAIDNCSSTPVVTFTEVMIDVVCPGTYTLKRTWSAMDECENPVEAVRFVFVSDQTPPVLASVPNDLDASCDEVPEPPVVTASDNCGLAPTVSFTEEMIDVACAGTYTLKRTWSAMDECQNPVEAVRFVYVADQTPPVLAGVPDDLDANCDEVPEPPMVAATDNCGEEPTVNFNEEMIDVVCPGTYTLKRTWSALDECDNPVEEVRYVFVSDQTPPVLAGVPEDLDASCDEVPEPPLVTASDNCGEEPTVNFNEEMIDVVCPGTYTLKRTWSALDECDNPVEEVRYVFVSDQTPPVLAGVPEDLDASCDEVPEPPLVTASDNCGLAPTVNFNEEMIDVVCSGTYLKRTWSAMDECQNPVEAVRFVYVSDQTPPVLAGVPEDLDASCDEVPEPPMVAATDNCGEEPTVNFNEEMIDVVCSGTYTLKRTWSAMDECDNPVEEVRYVFVSDQTPPVLAGVPDDLDATCDEVPEPPTVTASDNCGTAPEVSFTEDMIDVACSGTYTLRRTWSAMDECQNPVEAVRFVYVSDQTPPVLAGVPKDLDASCDKVPEPPVVTATDLCTDDPSIEAQTTITPGLCENDFYIHRIWIATDGCNNSSSDGYTIHVSDKMPPILLGVPADAAASCDDIPLPATPSAQDNCDLNVSILFDEEVVPGSCIGNYQIIRTWTAEDNCSNQIESSQVISVTDQEAPILIGAPGNIQVECMDVPDPPAVTALDNCDPTPAVLFFETSTQTDNGSCSDLTYKIYRRWTAVDACGNSHFSNQIIQVADKKAPVFTTASPPDLTISCLEAIPPAPEMTAEDQCDPAPTVTFQESSNRTNNGSCTDFTYKITRKWTAADKCGNSRTVKQVIQVIDNDPPVLDQVPEDVTVDCDASLAEYHVIALDACDPSPKLQMTSTDDYNFPGMCAYNYRIRRLWVATDACLNTAEAEQFVTTVDNEPPVIDFCPPDITIESDQSIPVSWPEPEAWDDCQGDNFLEIVQVKGPAPGTSLLPGTIQQICYVIRDECGNESSCCFTVTIKGESPFQLLADPIECKNIIITECQINDLNDIYLFKPEIGSSVEWMEKTYRADPAKWHIYEYANGTASLQMQFYLTDDPGSGWNIYLYFKDFMTYQDWNEAGGPDPVLELNEYRYLNWRFYLMHADSSGILGFGKLSDEQLHFTDLDQPFECGLEIGFDRNLTVPGTDIHAKAYVRRNTGELLGKLDILEYVSCLPHLICLDTRIEIVGPYPSEDLKILWSDGTVGPINTQVCYGHHKVMVTTPDNQTYFLEYDFDPGSYCTCLQKEICNDGLDNDEDHQFDQDDKYCIPLRGKGWSEVYYDQPGFIDPVDCGVTPDINFNWGLTKPSYKLKDGAYSAIYRGELMSKHSGTHLFRVRADGLVDLTFDDRPAYKGILNTVYDKATFPYDLRAGCPVRIKLKYSHWSGEAGLILEWKEPGEPWRVIPYPYVRTLINPDCSLVPSDQFAGRTTTPSGVTAQWYPNPTNGLLTLDLTHDTAEELQVTIQMFDLLGRLVMETKTVLEGKRLTQILDMSQAEPGTYIGKVQMGDILATELIYIE